MKQLLLACALLPLTATASDNCVLQDRIITRSAVVISERTPIRRDVVPYFGNQKKCIVDFRVRVGSDWHTAMGEYVWDGARPEDQACGQAVIQAENSVRERLGRSQSVGEKILVCKDQPKLTSLANTEIGTVGDVGQFRPHPQYLGRFYHNGTQCRWFVDTNFTGRDVKTFQGIICEVQGGKWVVIDKF